MILTFFFLLNLAWSLYDPWPFDSSLFYLSLSSALLAFLTGASLAASGAALQMVLKNPLAEPYMLGVSGGAALMGSLGLYLSGAFIPFWAMLGGILATLPLLLLKKARPNNLLLLGFCLNLWTSSLLSLLKLLGPPELGQTLLFWLSGSLMPIEPGMLLFLYVFVGLCLLFFISQKNKFHFMGLGDYQALTFGVNPQVFTQQVVFLASLMTGLLMAYSGLIGFVGLLIPHGLRLFGVWDRRLLIPLSAYFGGMTLLFLNTLSKHLFTLFYTELPLGLLTAVLGCPFLIFILYKKNKPSSNPTKHVWTLKNSVSNNTTPVWIIPANTYTLGKHTQSWPQIPLYEGDILQVVGQSGCGKTVFLHHLIEQHHQHISLAFSDQWDHTQDSMPTWARMQAHHKSAKPLKRTRLMAHELDLTQVLEQPFYTLSGGQKKRVNLASCLLKKARIYLLDEPFSNLDITNKKRALKAIQKHIKQNKSTFILSIHKPIKIKKSNVLN